MANQEPYIRRRPQTAIWPLTSLIAAGMELSENMECSSRQGGWLPSCSFSGQSRLQNSASGSETLLR